MGTNNIDTIKSGYEAFGRGDIPAVLEVLDDGIVWTVPPVEGWGGEFRGMDAVLGFFTQLPDRYGAGWKVQPCEFLSDGDRVVAIGRHEFGDGDLVPFVHTWTVRDGKATAFDEYVDNVALLRHVVTAAATG